MVAKLKQLGSWLDRNLLVVLTSALIVLIPALPKLPLADLIEGYIVRLRAEDILVGFTALVWLVQLVRKKVTIPKNIVTYFILAYLIIGAASSLSAVFVTKTVPLQWQHLAKLSLHYVRRLEYMSLFFITYSSIRSKKELKLFLKLMLTTIVLVAAYGFGQKYLYWPAFSTMNREFSKGMRLYLTPESRVMSTFAGHYDYAAYLMMALVALITAIWVVKSWKTKLSLFLLTLAAYWSLILTASRTSFLGYLFGVTIAAVLARGILPLWKRLLNWLVVVSLSLTVMLTLGDLSERFFQVLQTPDILIHEITQKTPLQRDSLEKFSASIEGKLVEFQASLTTLKENLYKPFKKKPPKNAISTDDVSKVAVRSDTPPTPVKPELPPDVTPEEDLFRKEQEASLSGSTKISETSGYSPNALKYGLSVAIRLDALWPRAIAGFRKNPLLGSGYSTLVKEELNEFTQAESTDNDFLRMLGETGILGTVTFLGAIFSLCYLAFRILKDSSDVFAKAFAIGLVGIVGALLVNAVYIDVFESSKVIYTFWMLAAILVYLYENRRSLKLSAK